MDYGWHVLLYKRWRHFPFFHCSGKFRKFQKGCGYSWESSLPNRPVRFGHCPWCRLTSILSLSLSLLSLLFLLFSQFFLLLLFLYSAINASSVTFSCFSFTPLSLIFSSIANQASFFLSWPRYHPHKRENPPTFAFLAVKFPKTRSFLAFSLCSKAGSFFPPFFFLNLS